MSSKDLIAAVEDPDSEVGKGTMNNLKAYTIALPGSMSYFDSMAKQSVAYLDHMRARSDDEQKWDLFQTFSLPDLHLDSIHKILPGSKKYLGKTLVSKLSDIPEGEDPRGFLLKKDDFLLRTAMIDKHTATVVDFFIERVECFVNEVLQ